MGWHLYEFPRSGSGTQHLAILSQIDSDQKRPGHPLLKQAEDVQAFKHRRCPKLVLYSDATSLADSNQRLLWSLGHFNTSTGNFRQFVVRQLALCLSQSSFFIICRSMDGTWVKF